MKVLRMEDAVDEKIKGAVNESKAACHLYNYSFHSTRQIYRLNGVRNWGFVPGPLTQTFRSWYQGLL